jgi:hypothetical protein
MINLNGNPRIGADGTRPAPTRAMVVTVASRLFNLPR